MAYNAISIANYIIALGKRLGPKVTNLRLQALLYYSHGWYLVIENKPLLNENIEAWEYGPYVASVYHEFKRFGNGAIDKYGEIVDLTLMESVIAPTRGIESAAIEVIAAVWDKYCKLTDIQIFNSLHTDDGPWATTIRNNPEKIRVDIPDELIKEYLIGIAENNRAKELTQAQ